MRKPYRLVLWLLTLVLVSGLLAGCCGLAPRRPSRIPLRATEEPTPTPIPATATPAPPLVSGPVGVLPEGNILETIYERANPSVVNITVRTKSPLGPFSGIPEIPGFPRITPNEPDFYREGQGSGFVYDAQGHIVTNNHVVRDADEVQITFSDGRTVPAEIVGTDPDSDLAVLKVDAESLQPLPLGDSDALRVGQPVVAIGNPFGLQGTMTFGIVSALGRLLPAGGATGSNARYTIPDIIQTDAAINPGNSGGPLLDMQGRVVGVNAAIESPVRASSGVGFAIPVNIVKKVVPALIARGYYEHPWLGISALTLNPDVARANGYPETQRGVLVVDVTQDSPADAAGLHGSDRTAQVRGEDVPVGGDVIIAIDDQPVRKFDDLISYMARETEVGQTVTLTVLREGQQESVQVTLAARPHSK